MDKAPAAVGPDSMAIQFDNLVFTGGQLPIDPENGNIVTTGIEAETRQALTNLQNVLEAAGSSLDMVVKTTVFLKDINDFGKINSVYAKFFKVTRPARPAFQVLALPKAASVEIESIAVIPGCP